MYAGVERHAPRVTFVTLPLYYSVIFQQALSF